MKYNIMFYDGGQSTKIEVEGKLVDELKEYGIYFVRKDGSYWTVDEYTSGRNICSKESRKKAIETAVKVIEFHGIEKVKELIEAAIKLDGYANKNEVVE